MKQSSFVRWLAIGLTAAFALPAFADIIKVGDGYRLETCGFSADKKFEATVQGRGVSQGGRTNAQGCVVTTFRDGRAGPGDNIIIDVEGASRRSETVPGSPAPTPDPREVVDIYKVRQTAENQARFFANRVVIVYGDAENFRFNLYTGLRQGVALYDLSNIGGLQNTMEFREGFDRGQSIGGGEGAAAGRNAGDNDGSSAGQGQAVQRYRAVVDTGNPPNLEEQISQPQFSGLQSVPAVASISDRLDAMNSNLRQQMSAIRFGDSEYAMGWEYDSNWSLRELYGWSSYQDTLVRGWYRSDWAFDLYKQRRLGGNYGSSLEYLARISDSSRTKNSSEARNAYENAFKSEYNNVIDQKWYSVVRRSNPPAQMIGLTLGQQAARDYTRDLGYSQGYSRAFTEGSLQTYSGAYQAGFHAGFGATVKKYESSVVLDGGTGMIFDNNGQSAFVLGLPVMVRIDHLANLGRQNGTILVGAGAGLGRTDVQSFELKYSTSVQQPVRLHNVGVVAVAPEPGKAADITVLIAAKGFGTQGGITRKISLDWANQVRGLGVGTANNPALVKYVVDQIAKEWDKNDGILGSNPYEPAPKNKVDTLLEQMVRASQALGPQERAQVQGLKTALKATFGPRPGFLSFAKRKKWDTAAALIDSL